MVAQRNPMHSVMLLIVSFGALAGLYVLLDAPFTAVTQIIIYAGAIMVLFLFVVMLLNVPREEPPPPSRLGAARADRACGSACCCRWCSASRSSGRCRGSGSRLVRRRDGGDVGELGRASSATSLFTRHAFAFEATSILILVAMVGAVVLARKGALTDGAAQSLPDPLRASSSRSAPPACSCAAT